MVSTIHQHILLCPFPSLLVHYNDLQNTLYRQCLYFFNLSFCLYSCQYNSCFWRSYLQYLVAAVCPHLFKLKCMLLLFCCLCLHHFLYFITFCLCTNYDAIILTFSLIKKIFFLSFKLTASEVVILLHYIGKTVYLHNNADSLFKSFFKALTQTESQ